MDLNASPLPEEDEEYFESHLEENVRQQDHIETSIQTLRRVCFTYSDDSCVTPLDCLSCADCLAGNAFFMCAYFDSGLNNKFCTWYEVLPLFHPTYGKPKTFSFVGCNYYYLFDKENFVDANSI